MYPSCAFKSEAHFTLGRHELGCLHKKIDRPDIGEKSNEKIRNEFNSPLSGLERRTSDVVCQENGSPTPVVQTPAITMEDDDGVSDRVSDFVIELAVIQLQLAKHGEQ